MINLEEEKSRLTEKLSDQYSKNAISLEEYERLLEYVNKIETSKEVVLINNMIQGNSVNTYSEAPALRSKKHEEYLALFSWRTTTLKPQSGKGGKFTSLFGTNRIIVDTLPPGKTVIHIECVFGLTEIAVSQHIRIVNKINPVFAGVFAPDETSIEDENLPELHIKGEAIFGNVTITRI